MSDLQSRPFRPDASKCCEACVFGAGDHADWCAQPPCAEIVPRPANDPLRAIFESAEFRAEWSRLVSDEDRQQSLDSWSERPEQFKSI